MIRKRYAIHPGHVVSVTDDEIHYVTATELIRLYEVDPKECIIVEPKERPIPVDQFRRRYGQPFHLYPQRHYKDYKKIAEKLQKRKSGK